MKDIKSLAILGGSFNPIHSGHVMMAVQTYDEYKPDEIVIMPNKSTYYKENKEFADDKHRMKMIELAIKDYPYMSLSDMEIRRGGVTHTIDTIREYKTMYPHIKPYFIIGGDSLEWIDKWVDADELLDSMIVLSAVRGATDRRRSERIISNIKLAHPTAEIHLLDMAGNTISSSDIREKIKRGERIEGLVPEAVEKYIYDNKLYIE